MYVIEKRVVENCARTSNSLSFHADYEYECGFAHRRWVQTLRTVSKLKNVTISLTLITPEKLNPLKLLNFYRE